MNELIDFSNAKTLIPNYAGAATKLKIEYEGNIYLLKFGQVLPRDEKKPMQASYENSQLSEHLGSRIFELCGIDSQNTLLGTYEGRKVVACLDFIESSSDPNNFQLVEFRNLETSFLGSTSSRRKTPVLEETMEIFEKHPYLEGIRSDALYRYWEMFVVDSLIGNFDRHAGNWGYILDKEKNQLISPAPVYDCGSSFYPRMNDPTMIKMIDNPRMLQRRGEDFPRAALKIGDKKVRYHEFWVSPEAKDARRVLVDVYQRIDLNKIFSLINSTPGVTETQKKFFAAMIESRHENILQPAYRLAIKEKELDQMRSVSICQSQRKNKGISPKDDLAMGREAARAFCTDDPGSRGRGTIR